MPKHVVVLIIIHLFYCICTFCCYIKDTRIITFMAVYFTLFTTRIFNILHIFKKQLNTLIKTHKKRLQNTLYIRCQVLHVSTPRCIIRDFINDKRLVGPVGISGAIRPHCYHVWRCCSSDAYKHLLTTPKKLCS